MAGFSFLIAEEKIEESLIYEQGIPIYPSVISLINKKTCEWRWTFEFITMVCSLDILRRILPFLHIRESFFIVKDDPVDDEKNCYRLCMIIKEKGKENE